MKGIFAAILAGVGGLCAIFGIVIAIDAVTIDIGEQFTWNFWFILSAILFLASIAISVGSKGDMVD